MPTQDPQAMPSFDIALHPDRNKTISPSLLYPSRPSPWSGSLAESAPLKFSKTTRPELAVAAPIVQVPTGTPNICLDTCSVLLDAFRRASMSIWRHLSTIVQKLKFIKQKLSGV